MTQSELLFALGLIVGLVALSLAASGFVRLLLPLRDEPEIEPGDSQAPAEILTLRDYWEGAIPHLCELRNRLLKSVAAVFVGAMVGFWLISDTSPIGPLPSLIVAHFAPGRTLQAIGVAEVFVQYIG